MIPIVIPVYHSDNTFQSGIIIKNNLMRKIINFMYTHRFIMCSLIVIVLAATFRFYDYQNRYVLGADQARDAIIARFALTKHMLPLTGPFSSAGPFFTGPEWFWFVMLGSILYPGSFLSPWVLLTCLFILAVYIIFLIGNEIRGILYGFIAGLLSAVSPVEITHTANLTNPVLTVVFSTITILFAVKYAKVKASIYSFLTGLSTGIAVSIHFQSIFLIPFPIFIILLNKPKLKQCIYFLIGLLIPFIPFIYFDMRHNFYEIHHILQYYLHDQYKISLNVLGRRWLTYILIFWPQTWAYIIGGSVTISSMILIISLCIFVVEFLKKSLLKTHNIILITVFIAVVGIRYTRVSLHEDYFFFLHPFVFLITGWTLYKTYSWNKILGVGLCVLVTASSIISDFQNFPKSNPGYERTKNLNLLLTHTFPNKYFAVYDYGGLTSYVSFPLSLILSSHNQTDTSGKRIGILTINKQLSSFHRISTDQRLGYQLIDLSGYSNASLIKSGWHFVNPPALYAEIEEWYK